LDAGDLLLLATAGVLLLVLWRLTPWWRVWSWCLWTLDVRGWTWRAWTIVAAALAAVLAWIRFRPEREEP